MHSDLEHVGNRVHNVRMCAIREDILDSLVQVLVSVGTTVNLCAFTKEIFYLRQSDDFRILVTNIRQNAIENFRFNVIDLRGGENGADEGGREEGCGRVGYSQQRKGGLREVPPFSGFWFL